VQEHAEKIVNDRATVEASLGRLRAEEHGLHDEISALRVERTERSRELAEASEHLASLDAALAAEELTALARAHDLASARRRLERDRDLILLLEQEILEVRSGISSAAERLRGLVENVLRIQHKLWRVTNRTGESPLAGG
jgi:hypothetical protein